MRINYKITVPDPYEDAYQKVIRMLNEKQSKREMEAFEDALREHGYVKERTCHMTCKKSGPMYDVWYFDCCEEEWAESRCDSHVVDYPGLFCPWCGAKVVE